MIFKRQVFECLFFRLFLWTSKERDSTTASEMRVEIDFTKLKSRPESRLKKDYV